MIDSSPVPLTPEYIEESWDSFNSCENDKHHWKHEPLDSPFYKRCTKCGGAEGLRIPGLL